MSSCQCHFVLYLMNVSEKPTITYTKSPHEASCSDAVLFLRQINSKFQSVSYELTQRDESGKSRTFTSHLDKPAVAAEKIEQLLRETQWITKKDFEYQGKRQSAR